MELLRHLDHLLFNWINIRFSAAWLDPLMITISSKWIWVPFYVVILAALIVKYKTNAIGMLVLLGLVVTLSDGISSKVLKPWVKRLRPNQVERVTGVHSITVRTPDSKDGNSKYGFPSSHAANSTAIFLLTVLLLQLRGKYAAAVLSIPLLVSYSRVYLGVHYPFDVFAGMLLGTTLVWLAWRIYGRCLVKNCSK